MNKHNLKKTDGLSQLLRLSVLAMAAFSLAGCMSTSHDKGDAAARSLERASVEVQAQSHALDLTMTSLNDLVNNPGPDLKPQFAAFSGYLSRLVASANKNESAYTNINRKASAYFDDWGKQLAAVNYEVIRNQGESRRSEVKKNFDEVNHQYREAQSALLPLIDYLQDVRKTLSADLTVGGLQSVKGFLTNAQENSAKVQAALAKVSSALASSGASLSTSSQTAKVEGTNAPPPVTGSRAAEVKK